MVDQLHEPSIGIAAIEAPGAVAVGARRGVDDDTVGFQIFVPGIHGLGIRQQETDVVEVLWTGWKGLSGRAVQRYIIGARGEIDIVCIGPPLDPHAEEIDIESLRALEIADIQGHMTEAEGCRRARCGHRASITQAVGTP